MAYPTIPVTVSSTGPRMWHHAPKAKIHSLGLKINITCAVAQCLSIAKQLIFGRRYPVISFFRQRRWMADRVVFKNCKSITLGYCYHCCCKYEITYFLMAHTPYVLFLCVNSKLWSFSFTPRSSCSSFK